MSLEQLADRTVCPVSGERKLAAGRAEHEAGVRRQKALLAEIGVPDVTPEELRASCSPDIREEPSLSG